MVSITDLPALNASLNFCSALLIGAGYYFVRHGKVQAHKLCMIAALGVSTLFLTSYLIYHYNAGSVRFQHPGWIRYVYFGILITHVTLAAVILPMVLRTAYLALRGRFANHIRIARWSFPLWMYVSVTGVVVYLMLYRL